MKKYPKGMNNFRCNKHYCNNGAHAECVLVNKLHSNNRKKKRSLKSIDLIVIRVNRLGELGESKPCINCVNYMNRILPIKGYRLRNVYYSTKNGIVKENFQNLILNVTHKSKSYRKNKF